MSGIKKKTQKNNKNIERWYYDACAIDSEKHIYGEIVSKKNPIKPIISHLALGEAYGNCCYKYKKNYNKIDAFCTLIGSLVELHCVEFIGNDDIDSIFTEIKNNFGRLSITDAIHLSTAIKSECNILRTTDPDLLGIPGKKITDFCEKSFGIKNFKITKIKNKK